MYRGNRFIAAIMISMVLTAVTAFGQVQFSFPIHVQGATSADTGTVVVGVNEGVNTYAADLNANINEWREFLAPPAPPSGWDFWAGFFDIPGRTEIGTISAGTGMRPNDFRGFTSSADIDTFCIRVTGNNVPNGDITITWPANLNAFVLNARLLRKAGQNWTSVVPDMLASSSYTQDNSGGNGTYNFLLILQPKAGGSGVSIQDITELLPDKFEMSQNYPNPFNPATNINFSVKTAGQVRIAIYNILGQQIAVLVDNRLASGRYTINWNGIDSNGNALSSGIYFYRMTSGDFVEMRKMLLLK